MTSRIVAIEVGAFDRQVFAEGHHWHAYRFLGAHVDRIDGVDGVRFATWAPGAKAVRLAGDFNAWNPEGYALHAHPGGIWAGFVADVAPGACYKFEIEATDGRRQLKSDPYAQRYEAPPRTASVVVAPSQHAWRDGDWISARAARDWLHAPMSIYELHLGSWKRHPDGRYWSYRELAAELPSYVRDLGFTHVELLPVMEHPYDPSWGYQVIGNFAPTARFGTPDDFRALIDACHSAGLGVLLDWVPAHFPRDAHGLARFDGHALYEHADPRRGEHPDWDTLIYDYGRPEVRNYLLASALFWLEEFHADGLRVDAVASMLYLDYSRAPGEWLPNVHGGRENLEAVEFLRELNSVVHAGHPGAVVIAEESTSWPQVSRPTSSGGLGFSMKWDLGWMHDTLDYLAHQPVHRRYHHNRLTFSQLYRYTENFVLPLSHDEVVHGKRSLLQKMPGDRWQQFANLRLLLTYWATCPGKKLLFMGQEFAQPQEWNQDAELAWACLADPAHAGMQRLVRDLNTLYRERPALHRHDFEQPGFEWLDCHDAEQSTLTYLRRAGDDIAIVALNFTPVPRHGFRVGVPQSGRYVERFNSDSQWYAGTNLGGSGTAESEPLQWAGRPHSIQITLPPLAGVILIPE